MNGVICIHEKGDNRYDVGQIYLESGKHISFNTLGKKWRTGQNSISGKILPESSLKNNIVRIGDIKITATSGNIYASLLMYNASNAKNNTLNYGNIDIKCNKTYFYGMGNLQNKQPEGNFHENIAENNYITMKNLNIETEEAPFISLMACNQHKEQKLRNCTVKSGRVNVKLNGNEESYIGGIAAISNEIIDSCRVFLDSVKIENTGNKNIYFGLGAARANDTTIKNSGVFVDGGIDVQSKRLYGGGFIGFAKKSTIEDNDLQVDGKSSIKLENGVYGGFYGWFADSTSRDNSSLILNDFVPFAGYAKGGIITGAAHYVKGKAPQYLSGLLGGGKNDPRIINSTLLVEKEFEDTILYRKESISEDSGDNYLVVVDGGSDFNRTAYAVAETVSTSEEMGKEIPVFKKIGEPIGKINIKSRTFQERYWNTDVAPYEVGNEENNFDYMIKNQAGQINAFALTAIKLYLLTEQKQICMITITDMRV